MHAPDIALVTMAIGKVVDIPHNNVVTMVNVNAVRIAGFRPNVSEALPPLTPVKDCERENTADVIPAHLATFSPSPPKLSIISG